MSDCKPHPVPVTELVNKGLLQWGQQLNNSIYELDEITYGHMLIDIDDCELEEGKIKWCDTLYEVINKEDTWLQGLKRGLDLNYSAHEIDVINESPTSVMLRFWWD